MKRYQITLTGTTDLLMHDYNFNFDDFLLEWRMDPANKKKSKAGDDRTPAFRWLGYTYHADGFICMPADNIMSMLCAGGAKVPAKKYSYKKIIEAGVVLDELNWDFSTCGKRIPFTPLYEALIGNEDFLEQKKAVKEAGFWLWEKPVVINGKARHIRVRPRFEKWETSGSITVLDEKKDGITKKVLETILREAGSLVGLCDWRPKFGRFTAAVKKM